MNVEKMTERVGDALNAAYARALHEHNTQTAPEHMLAALLEQERGIAPDIVARPVPIPRRSGAESTRRLGSFRA